MKSKFEDAWKRVKKLTGWTKKGELASFLGITNQSVSGAIKRGNFPLDWAYRIANAYDSNTDWIMDERGDIRHACKGKCTSSPVNRDGHIFSETPAFEPGLLGYIYNEILRIKDEHQLKLTNEQKIDVVYLSYNFCLESNKKEALIICSIVKKWHEKNAAEKNSYLI